MRRAAGLLGAAVWAGWAAIIALAPSTAAFQEPAHTASPAPAVYFCPMHPDVTASTPGRCRKCDMAMVAGDPFDTRDYGLDLQLSPAAITAGRPFRITLAVRHPDTAALVRDFETVHDKRFHLFLVSQDMTAFQHLHPEQQPDGSWAMTATVPATGYYRVIADFLPAGASPQLLSRTIATTATPGDAFTQVPRLEEDWRTGKTAGSLTASVSIEPMPLVEGQWGHVTFALRDAATGEPAVDLQPYLAAFGHMLMMSGDMRDSVHAHPTARPENDIARGAGGPEIQFEGYMPRAGHYRAWTQFQRGGDIITIPYTFRVLTLEESVRGSRE